MATVVDLYTRVSTKTSLEFEEARHLARTMQKAGLLPTGRRGGWRNAPEITYEDCARFVIALAVTRTSGSRTATRIREKVEKFSKLVWRDPPRYRETLIERLVMLMRCEMTPGLVWLIRIAFWDDPVWPTVELEYAGWSVGDEYLDTPAQVFVRPRQHWTKKDQADLETDQMATGFKMGPKFFGVFRSLLDDPVALVAGPVFRPFKDAIAECERLELL